jgi:hypothetical protein
VNPATLGRIANAIGDPADRRTAMPRRGETRIQNSIAPLPCAAALGIAVSERAFEQLEGKFAGLSEPSP